MASHWFPITMCEAAYLLEDAATYESLAFLWDKGFKPDSKGETGGIILLCNDDAPYFKELYLNDFAEMFYPDMPGLCNSLNEKIAAMIVPIS